MASVQVYMLSACRQHVQQEKVCVNKLVGWVSKYPGCTPTSVTMHIAAQLSSLATGMSMYLV